MGLFQGPQSGVGLAVPGHPKPPVIKWKSWVPFLSPTSFIASSFVDNKPVYTGSESLRVFGPTKPEVVYSVYKKRRRAIKPGQVPLWALVPPSPTQEEL